MKHRGKGNAESGARYSMFVTLREGLSSLVQAMVARLPEGTVSSEFARRADRTRRGHPAPRGVCTWPAAPTQSAVQRNRATWISTR